MKTIVAYDNFGIRDPNFDIENIPDDDLASATTFSKDIIKLRL